MGFVVLAGRMLPPHEFATLGSALAVVYLASVLVTPATGAVAQLFVEAVAAGRGGGLRALLRVALRRAAFWAVAVAGLAWAAAPWLARLGGWQDPGAVAAVGATVGALMVLAPVRGALRGQDRLVAFNRSLVLEAALRLLLGAALLAASPSAGAALAAYAAASLAAALAAGLTLDLPPSDAEVDLSTRLRGIALGFLAVQVLVAAFHNVDMLLVRKLASTDDAALYAGAVSIARTIGFLYLPFSILIVPRTAAAASRGEPPLGPGLRLVSLFVVAAVPLVALFLAIPEVVAGRLLGETYAAAGPILARLGPAFLIGGVNALLAQALAVRGRFGFLLPFGSVLALQVVALGLYRGPVAGFADRVLAAHALALVGLAVAAWNQRRPG